MNARHKLAIATVLCLGLGTLAALNFQPVVRAAQPPATSTSGPQENSTGQPAPGKGKPLPTVQVETIQPATFTRAIPLTGSVVPTRTAVMASPGEGPVEPCETRRCLPREGDLVRKGQILLHIGRNMGAEALLTAMQQAVREQELEFMRVEQLVQAGALPASRMDAARTQYENARAQLAKGLEGAQDYSVKAPWEGLVSRVHVAEGDYVAPRAPLIEIFDPESLVVRFSAPESLATSVRTTMRVEVELDAHPGKTFPGTVARVYPQLDGAMRTRTIEATLEGEPQLLPGMFARVRLVVEEIPEALTIPTDALLTTPQGKTMVFVLQDGKALLREILPGSEERGRILVLSGLRPGDRVIAVGNETLKDGAQVRALGDSRS